MKRLRQLHSRLKIDTPSLREYDAIIKDQDKTGMMEHVVDKQTTKVWVVFDGCAKSSKDDLFRKRLPRKRT